MPSRRGALAVALALIAAAAPSSIPTSVAAALVPGTTCRVLPADNIWNTDVTQLPVHPRSAAWLTSAAAATTNLHPDFGGSYGIPFNVVYTSHPTTNFNFQYWDESDPVVPTRRPQGPYPYGNDLHIEGPTDSHLLTVDQDTCKLYETGGTNYNGPSTAWSGAIFDLNSDQLRPAGWTSADAAGLPIFPGLVRHDEVQAGFIGHAIRFTVVDSSMSYLWPARHQAGSTADPNVPPMGARFRLKSSYAISAFGPQAQVVLTAMKHYGLIVADNGSNWFFQGTTDAGWDSGPYPTMVAQLKTVPAGAFEAVDESSLMVDPNSGQVRTARGAPVNQAPPVASTGRGTVNPAPPTSTGPRRPQHPGPVVRVVSVSPAPSAQPGRDAGGDRRPWHRRPPMLL